MTGRIVQNKVRTRIGRIVPSQAMRKHTEQKPLTVDRREFAKMRSQVRRYLEKVADDDPEYWNFKTNGKEVVSRKLFQYPAMMVPALQKQVITAMLKARPAITTILDPFVGSGTVLTLAMMSGRAFVGQDVNPLAILIAKTRAFSLDYTALSTSVDDVVESVGLSRCSEPAVRFVGQSKWFTDGASLALTKLRRAIQQEASVASRRFLWVCLAETVRLNSNSRTSTFKLHIKPAEQQNASEEKTINDYKIIAARNLLIVEEFARGLHASGYLKHGQYANRIRIDYGDSTKRAPVPEWEDDEKADLIVTSPPYGDNRTTVPYGQASWLPLKWIDMSDIDSAIPRDAAKQAYDVDNRSLGGVRSATSLKIRIDTLVAAGSKTAEYIKQLQGVSKDGLSRFVHFAFDMKLAMAQAANTCRSGGGIVLTTGHRNISGTLCPLTDICIEMLVGHDFKEVVRIDRKIQSKRMAQKNKHSSTINHEYISILRKQLRCVHQ